ncbi:hypothetical protein NDU88_006374 [Pleurodeles waltl]|uniref:SWIM-type domain-containing protein n=1 Tax=Pleurodeles waltl TaxID=8319 RepID=A0AAV7QNE1_PLEWA|nr:hypothetical protein NDU88_006374 [Pleurodeles waltl]
MCTRFRAGVFVHRPEVVYVRTVIVYVHTLQSWCLCASFRGRICAHPVELVSLCIVQRQSMCARFRAGVFVHRSEIMYVRTLHNWCLSASFSCSVHAHAVELVSVHRSAVVYMPTSVHCPEVVYVRTLVVYVHKLQSWCLCASFRGNVRAHAAELVSLCIVQL